MTSMYYQLVDENERLREVIRRISQQLDIIAEIAERIQKARSEKIETIEMATGFIRATIGIGGGESYGDLLDDDAVHQYAISLDGEVRYNVLEEILIFLKGEDE